MNHLIHCSRESRNLLDQMFIAGALLALPLGVLAAESTQSTSSAGHVSAGPASTPIDRSSEKSVARTPSAAARPDNSARYLNPPLYPDDDTLPSMERAARKVARMSAFDSGPNRERLYQRLHEKPADQLTDRHRIMLRYEPVYRESLATLQRGEVLAFEPMFRLVPDTKLTGMLLDRQVTSEAFYRSMSTRCRDVTKSTAGFSACVTGSFTGTVTDGLSGKSPAACQVIIGKDGTVSFTAAGKTYAPLRIRYRAAGADFTASGDIRVADIRMFTGWVSEGARRMQSMADVFRGERSQALDILIASAGGRRNVQMRFLNLDAAYGPDTEIVCAITQ